MRMDSGTHTFNHCFSSFVSILSLTIRVWIGTQVRRSKPSQMSPLKLPLVYEDVSEKTRKKSVEHTLNLRTMRADSIRIPHLPTLSDKTHSLQEISERKRERTETWLIRDYMPRNKGDVTRETLGTFVHSQEGAKPMPSSMLHRTKKT